ncbi:MAG: RND family efflux transporter MFP subunit [Bermanella sp.]
MLKKYKWLFAAIALLILTLVVLTMSGSEHSVTKVELDQYLPVTFVTLSPKSRDISRQLTGVTQARWPTQMVASVAGRVVTLPEYLEPGRLIKRHELMLALQDIAYLAEVERAASDLAIAELTLAKTRYEQTVAKKTSGRLNTPFARMEPQVAVGEKEVKAAKSSLLYAKQRLADTKVYAPFSAIILQRYVTPGQWAQPGEQVFYIAASDAIDIKVQVPENIWQQLGQLQEGRQAQIVSQARNIWQGNIRYINPMREAITRQRSVVIKVANPYLGEFPLLPDQQVQVIFAGPEQEYVIEAPASALTEDGFVWTIHENQILRKESVELLQQDAQNIWVRFSQQPRLDRDVVVYPLGSMVEGRLVQPKEKTSMKTVQL